MSEQIKEPISAEDTTSLIQSLRDLVKADSYILAVVAENEYMDSPLCPHCSSDNRPLTLEECMNLSNHIADLFVCTDCAQPFVTVAYPTLYDTYHPVYFQVTMRPGSHPLAEVVASSTARAFLAALHTPRHGIGD